MDYLEIALKLIVGLSILNVWLIRANKSTPYRGGDSKNITDEFAVYGLSKPIMIVVGTVKVILAILLLASIYYPSVEMIGAVGIAVLMLGAVGMHLKVGDPLMKSFPAALFLALSVVIYFI
jgi:hypothetical protein